MSGEHIGPSVYRTRLICDAYAAGDKLTDIAKRFGITKQRVEAIARAKGLPLRYAAKRSQEKSA